MEYYRWDREKNEEIKAKRGVGFEQVVLHIEQVDLLSVYDHPNQDRYPGQQILVVQIGDYSYSGPFRRV